MVLVYVNLFLKAREKAHYCLSKLSSLQVGVRAVSVFILASLLHIQFPIASANVLACCLIYCPCVKIVYITWPVQCLTFSLLFWGGVRFHYNDATAIHQLQNEVCGPPPMEDAHLQGSQYIYWWPVCLCHQDAHDVQDRMPQRRYVFTVHYTMISTMYPTWCESSISLIWI